MTGFLTGGARRRAWWGLLAFVPLIVGLTTAGVPAGAAPGTGRLPVKKIERIMQAEGTVTKSGVLEIDIDRSDLKVTGGTPRVRFENGFQIQHEVYFQSIGRNKAIMNGDLALRPQEIQRVIDGYLRHGIIFQAQHQHLYDLEPMVWFLHFRAVGDPLKLAGAIHDVIRRDTSTPLPQTLPKHPRTPLPAKRLGKILGGDAMVGENGIVSVTVRRTDKIRLGGIRVDPDLGVSTSVQFQPVGKGMAAVVPDFSMTSGEVQPVMRTMRRHRWEVGCLYNQETAEQPQLFFSHMFKVGDPITLARQVREGLDHTAAQRA